MTRDCVKVFVVQPAGDQVAMGLPQVLTGISSRTAEDSTQKCYLFALLPSHVDAVEKREEQRIVDED